MTESEQPAAQDGEEPTGSAGEGLSAGGLPAKKEARKIFGFPLHLLIFVGMFLGVALGLGCYYLDHFDKLTLQDGSVVEGTIRQAVDEWVVLLPDGNDKRIHASQVGEAGVVLARDTNQGALYGYAVWWFNFFGTTLFMSALKMIIAPLILASIVSGVVSLPGLDQLKRIGFKTMAYYVCTTCVAVSLGLFAVLLVRPGHKDASDGVRTRRANVLKSREVAYKQETNIPARAAIDDKPTVAFLEWLAVKEAEEAGTGHESARFGKLSGAREIGPLDMIKNQLVRPMLSNPFWSLSKEGSPNSMGIITFALLLGVAIVIVGPPAKPVGDLFVGFNAVILRITEWLMLFAPFCVMCIVAELAATQGPEVFLTLAWYVVAVLVGIALHVTFLVGVAATIGKRGPRKLWNGIREAWLIAFTTRSSAATLPVTMRCVVDELKVSPRVANFALPVGATMNMDGTALYEGVAVIFLMQMFGGLADAPPELTVAATFIIFVTAVFASVGAAAVPDAGLITMVLVASAIGLPIYYIPIIFAVDAFLDMFRTSTNVLGDAVGCLVVEQLEVRAGGLPATG